MSTPTPAEQSWPTTRGTVTITPLSGIHEVVEGDDLATVVQLGLDASGVRLAHGDIVVVSSKLASKAMGLVTDDPDKKRVVAGESHYVVAERTLGDHVTRVVHAKAGPVMAAAGVDGSNTGERGGWLLLPHDPDAVCRDLRAGLARRHGFTVGVILSDTAGRPWRVGQIDFALGACGLAVLDDLRGGVDADGRPLSVTARAVADEIAAAADLVKGKADGVPIAIVRGLADLVRPRVDEAHGLADAAGHDAPNGPTYEFPASAADPTPEPALGSLRGLSEATSGGSARELVRTGVTDWFGYGRVEAVRAALGVEPGTELAAQVGIPPAAPDTREGALSRAVRLALHALPGATADVGPLRITVGADSPYELGVATARLQTALWCDGLEGSVSPPSADGLSVVLTISASVARGPLA